MDPPWVSVYGRSVWARQILLVFILSLRSPPWPMLAQHPRLHRTTGYPVRLRGASESVFLLSGQSSWRMRRVPGTIASRGAPATASGRPGTCRLDLSAVTVPDYHPERY